MKRSKHNESLSDESSDLDKKTKELDKLLGACDKVIKGLESNTEKKRDKKSSEKQASVTKVTDKDGNAMFDLN